MRVIGGLSVAAALVARSAHSVVTSVYFPRRPNAKVITYSCPFR